MMPTTTPVSLFTSDATLVFLKAAILIILLLYAIFSLIIIRQVDLMSKALISGISPIFKLATIIHAGIAVGLIFLAWGIL